MTSHGDDAMSDITDMLDELPERANGFEVFAKCLNCDDYLTINPRGYKGAWFVHCSTFDRNCRITHLSRPDRHQRWAQW
jgi:hypothetical protein